MSPNMMSAQAELSVLINNLLSWGGKFAKRILCHSKELNAPSLKDSGRIVRMYLKTFD